MALEPQELEQIKAGDLSPLKGVSDLGIIIRTPQQEEEYRNNLREQLINSESFPVISAVEKKVEELTGVKKQDGEKASDYLSRILSDSKQTVEQMKTELASLKKDSTGSKADQDRIKALEDMVKSEQAKAASIEKEYQTKLHDYKVSGERNTLLSMMKSEKYDEAKAPEASREYILDGALTRFEAKYKLEVNDKGETVLMEGDKPVLDPATLKPKNPYDVFKSEYLSPLLATPKTEPQGTGNKTVERNQGGSADYSSLTTRLDVNRQLAKDGYVAGSKEYDEKAAEIAAAYKQAKGTDMPLR